VTLWSGSRFGDAVGRVTPHQRLVEGVGNDGSGGRLGLIEPRIVGIPGGSTLAIA